MSDQPRRSDHRYEAGVYSARGIAELNQQVASLAAEGFRIITVFETHEEFYHVVAQRKIWLHYG